MIECEYKFLLKESCFNQIMKQAVTLYGPPRKKTQINNYYDDKTLSLNRGGVTARIRQAGGVGKLQVKRHNRDQNEYAMSEEIEQKIEGLPSKINLPEFGRLTLKGCLLTHRSSFNIGLGISLDMDVNIYRGQIDYEVEIEFDADAKEQAETIISALGLENVNHTSKSARFFTALEGIR